VPYMTDTGFTAAFVNYMYSGATNTMTAITTPLHARLMTALGSGNGNVHSSNGTELSAPGYTAGGATMGATAFSTFTSTSPAAITSNNSVSWSATGSWSTVVGLEIWNTSGSPLRQAQGATTSSISGVTNGDTVQFAASSISIDPTAW